MNHESSPRPLILARLREILQEQWFRALPRTLETLEKAGEPIGAQEAEINAVWQEIQPEADLLARVINAPPMAAGGGQPKEPRKKPALTPEQVGPLGEALLRAQREQAK